MGRRGFGCLLLSCFEIVCRKAGVGEEEGLLRIPQRCPKVNEPWGGTYI